MQDERIDKIIPKMIKQLEPFKDRYLKGVLINICKKYPDIIEDTVTLIENADKDRIEDSVNKRLEKAHLPSYPDHYQLSDFDPLCLSDEDLAAYGEISKGTNLYTHKPNLILYGLPNRGKEKLAIGLADEYCHLGVNVYYTDFSTLLEVLINKTSIPKCNTIYENLLKVDCLIIDDFPDRNLYDQDLISAIYTLLKTRLDMH
ncbi:MAG: ATP-binding protein, partial [Bacilli bacterium]|nr:ATP-binding protein [Bacilli bacterium]